MLNRRIFVGGIAVGLFAPARLAFAEPNLEMLTEAAARVLIVGFAGDQAYGSDMRRTVSVASRLPLGGFIHLAHNVRNAAAVTSVNAALRDASPEPPLLCVDEEGGRVRRLRRIAEVPATPSAAVVGKMNPTDSWALYARLALTLRALGFNLNFGPVLDLDRFADNTVISGLGRSFGADPATVAAHAAGFVAAHRSAGVMTAAKHYPGHGSTQEDPHHASADATHRWDPIELEPFRLLLRSREVPEFVMTSHQVVAHPALGADPRPVTYSPSAVATLWGGLGYGGVVISDDLTMKAALVGHTLGSAAVAAISAGHHCVIIAQTRTAEEAVESTLPSLVGAARSNPGFAMRLLAAADRMRILKAAMS